MTIGGQKILGGWSLDIQRIKIAGENGKKKTKTVKKGGEKMEINTKANAERRKHKGKTKRKRLTTMNYMSEVHDRFLLQLQYTSSCEGTVKYTKTNLIFARELLSYPRIREGQARRLVARGSAVSDPRHVCS